MKTKLTATHRSFAPVFRRWLAALSLLTLATTTTLQAQSTISIPSTGGGESISDGPTARSGAGLPMIPLATAPFQWGKVVFRPHASYSFVYGNGILSQTNREQKTIIQTLAPGMSIDLGEHWVFDYTARVTLYTEEEFEDTLDHALRLSGRTVYKDWSMALSLAGDITSDPLVETGTQTDQQRFSASAGVGHALTQDFSFDIDASISMRLTDQFNSSRDYSTMAWLNREWGPHLGVGVGIGAGYQDVDTGNDMTHQRFEGRVLWHLSQKINLSVNGGVEQRQFVGSDRDSLLNPVFGASVQYQLFDTTSLSLSANRAVTASYFANQVTEQTSVSLGVNQRLFGRLNLGLSGGYGLTTYQATSSSISVNREDSYKFFSINLGTSLSRRSTASIFYSYSDNSSNADDFEYASSRVGFQIGYRY